MANSVLSREADVFRQNDKKLFRIFNNLENGMRADAPQSGVTFEAVAALYEYLTHDLAEEEEGLSHSGGPEAQDHKKEYEYFKSTVNSYLSLMQFGSMPHIMDIRDFLANWIQVHSGNSQVLDRR